MNDKGTILVVEDTPADLELLVNTLAAEGYQVLVGPVRSADFQSAVSPISNRQIARNAEGRPDYGETSRLETCDTADWKSALRSLRRFCRLSHRLLSMIDRHLRPWPPDFGAWPILCLIWASGGCCIGPAMQMRARNQRVFDEVDWPPGLQADAAVAENSERE